MLLKQTQQVNYFFIIYRRKHQTRGNKLALCQIIFLTNILADEPYHMKLSTYRVFTNVEGVFERYTNRDRNIFANSAMFFLYKYGQTKHF